MANNELLVKRTAVFESVNLGNVVATHKSGVMIPAGAIITGVRAMAPGAVTLTDASATINVKVGTYAVITAIKLLSLGAQTIPTFPALLTTTGMYVPATDELIVCVQASANSSVTDAIYDFYVDYLYVV